MSSPPLKIGAALLALILTGYLLLPILTPVHVEGFTAAVASLAMHLQQGSLPDFDRAQPLNGEFYGLTKLGWVILTAAIGRLFDIGPTAAMALLSWTAAPAFAAGSAFLIRRWTGVPWLLIAALLMLFPGVSESAFFFNDNLVAAALAVGSLCALYIERRAIGAVLCGILFAAAVLTRADTVLIGLAIPLIVLERTGPMRPKLIALSIAGACAAVVLFGTLALFNATPLDILKVGSATVEAWARPTTSAYVAMIILYFLGPAGAVLTLCGAIAVAQRRQPWAAARLVLTPAIFLAILWSKMWEIRQLLPLTPFLASLAALAVTDLWSRPRTRGSMILPGLLLGLAAFSILGPATASVVKDGPRVLGGRVANIRLWQQWQRDSRADVALLETLADIPPGRSRAIIVDHWNEDRFGHLALQEAGYHVVHEPGGACAVLTEHFSDGSRNIYLVRLHQAHAGFWQQVAGERLRRWGLPCIAEVRPDDVILVARSTRLARLIDRDFADPRIDKVMAADPNHYWSLRAITLDTAKIAQIVDGYRLDREEARGSGEATATAADGMLVTRRRTNSRF